VDVALKGFGATMPVRAAQALSLDGRTRIETGLANVLLGLAIVM
jgi:hypothetical protein